MPAPPRRMRRGRSCRHQALGVVDERRVEDLADPVAVVETKRLGFGELVYLVESDTECVGCFEDGDEEWCDACHAALPRLSVPHVSTVCVVSLLDSAGPCCLWKE